MNAFKLESAHAHLSVMWVAQLYTHIDRSYSADRTVVQSLAHSLVHLVGAVGNQAWLEHRTMNISYKRYFIHLN